MFLATRGSCKHGRRRRGGEIGEWHVGNHFVINPLISLSHHNLLIYHQNVSKKFAYVHLRDREREKTGNMRGGREGEGEKDEDAEEGAEKTKGGKEEEVLHTYRYVLKSALKILNLL